MAIVYPNKNIPRPMKTVAPDIKTRRNSGSLGEN